MRKAAYIFTNLRSCSVTSGILLAMGAALGDEPALKEGAAFSRQLGEIVGVTWQDRALREGLDRLSRAYGIAIFLDRRIDPDQHLDVAISDVPLSNLLQQLAAQAHAQTTVVGSVVYVGPRETAAQIVSIAAQRRQDVSRLPPEVRAPLSRARSWQWAELAQPRELLRELASEAKLSVSNADAIPHDLWPALSLPPLVWADRMTLLLAGFGLTFEIAERGNSLRLAPFPTGPIADNRVPTTTASGTKFAKNTGQKLYSLKVQNEPAGNVVSTVAKSLGKELHYETEVLDKLKQRVTFDLKDATLDYLMQTTLKPLGLTYRVTDKQLQITDLPP